MKPDHERLTKLLTDTITLLCKNGLTYDQELRIQGLLGITVDSSEVFLVQLSECYSNATSTTCTTPSASQTATTSSASSDGETAGSSRKRPREDVVDLTRMAETPDVRGPACSSTRTRSTEGPMEGGNRMLVSLLDRNTQQTAASRIAQVRAPGQMPPPRFSPRGVPPDAIPPGAAACGSRTSLMASEQLAAVASENRRKAVYDQAGRPMVQSAADGVSVKRQENFSRQMMQQQQRQQQQQQLQHQNMQQLRMQQQQVMQQQQMMQQQQAMQHQQQQQQMMHQQHHASKQTPPWGMSCQYPHQSGHGGGGLDPSIIGPPSQAPHHIAGMPPRPQVPPNYGGGSQVPGHGVPSRWPHHAGQLALPAPPAHMESQLGGPPHGSIGPGMMFSPPMALAPGIMEGLGGHGPAPPPQHCADRCDMSAAAPSLSPGQFMPVTGHLSTFLNDLTQQWLAGRESENPAPAPQKKTSPSPGVSTTTTVHRTRPRIPVQHIDLCEDDEDSNLESAAGSVADSDLRTSTSSIVIQPDSLDCSQQLAEFECQNSSAQSSASHDTTSSTDAVFSLPDAASVREICPDNDESDVAGQREEVQSVTNTDSRQTESITATVETGLSEPLVCDTAHSSEQLNLATLSADESETMTSLYFESDVNT